MAVQLHTKILFSIIAQATLIVETNYEILV